MKGDAEITYAWMLGAPLLLTCVKADIKKWVSHCSTISEASMSLLFSRQGAVSSEHGL